MATTVQIRGTKELYEELSTRIPYRLEAKALQQALGAGAAVIVKEAKANIGLGDPYPATRTGTLERAVYQSRGRKTTPELAVRIVSVRKGRRAMKSNRDAYYGRMVEFGHRIGKDSFKGAKLVRASRAMTKGGEERYTTRLFGSGKKRIKGEREWTNVKPYPYMEPAVRTTQTRVQDVVLRRLQKLVEKAAAGRMR